MWEKLRHIAGLVVERSHIIFLNATSITTAAAVLVNTWPHCGQPIPLMKETMSQLYLCEEPYWSKYDHSDLYDHPIEINVISDGKCINFFYLFFSIFCVWTMNKNNLPINVVFPKLYHHIFYMNGFWDFWRENIFSL